MKSGSFGITRIQSRQLRFNRAMAGTAVAILALSGVLPLQGAAFAADDTGYELIDGLGGSEHHAWGLSADGSVMVGSSRINVDDTLAFRWTQAGGMVGLGTIDGDNSYARGVNADGTVVVGSASADYNTKTHAFRWTEAGRMVDLGTLGGGDSYANGVNADGTVVVGVSLTAGDAAGRAFRWVKDNSGSSSGGTMYDLNTLGGRDSNASSVNADGSVVVGDSDITGNAAKHAFRWTEQDEEMVDLGTLDGTNSYARGVNADGSVVIGESQIEDDVATHAFRWTEQDEKMVDLGTLGGTNSYARGVSADGSVVVGESQIAGDTTTRGFRWTAETETDDAKMLSVEDWLRENGNTVAYDFTKTANAVSADGNVVVGETTSGTIYIARLEAGIIDVDQYAQTLAAKPSATQIGLSYAGTTMNGVHGEPMRNLLDAGRQSFQITTDAGYDNGSLSDGGVGISDLTYGIGLEGGATARLSAGGLYTRQDIDTGGHFTQKALHVAPEVTLPVVDGVYATLGGYYSSGKLDIDRGYLNGGVLDYSRGETDTTTWGGKIRFDWLNAFSANDVKFTPYTSLTYSHARADAYTENGGGFPSSFDSVSDHSTVARVGLDAVSDITERFRLLGKVEADYRFEKQAAGVSGTIIGISGFNLEGQDIDQFWARAGIGAEFDTTVGTAFVSLNATTQGDDPTVWVKSGWKVTF